MSTRIYHNPRCSKSRQALQLLEENSGDFEVIEYLKTPPDATTLKTLLQKLGLSPRELMRKGQDEYTALGLDNPTLSDEELIRAMLENPVLIERPIVVTDKGVAIGRPPEKILEIL